MAVNGLVTRFSSSADVVYRQAILRALRGEPEAAQAQGDLAQANYPSPRGGVIRVVESLAAAGEGVAKPIHYTIAGSAKESQ